MCTCEKVRKSRASVPVPLPAPWPPLGACPARSAVFSIATTVLADSLRSPDRVVTASRNAIQFHMSSPMANVNRPPASFSDPFRTFSNRARPAPRCARPLQPRRARSAARVVPQILALSTSTDLPFLLDFSMTNHSSAVPSCLIRLAA